MRFFRCLALVLVLAAPALCAVNPIYTRLKAYRTYHEVESVDAQKVSLKVTTPAGATRTETYAVDPADVVVEGASSAVMGGYLNITIHHGFHDLTLPGTNGFTSFDVYPDADLRTSYVHGADGKKEKRRDRTR